MSEKKQSTLVPTRAARDPFALLRQMTSELDRAFEDWPSFRWPSFGRFAPSDAAAFLSRLHPSGARYEVLESTALGG